MAVSVDDTLFGYYLSDLRIEDAMWLMQFSEREDYKTFLRLFVEPMIAQKLEDLERSENAEARHVLKLLRKVQNLGVGIQESIGDARPETA